MGVEEVSVSYAVHYDGLQIRDDLPALEVEVVITDGPTQMWELLAESLDPLLVVAKCKVALRAIVLGFFDSLVEQEERFVPRLNIAITTGTGVLNLILYLLLY